MPDNLKKKKPQDTSRISLKEPYEVNWWCDNLGCSKLKLTNAVKKVGHSAAKVKKYLGK